MKTLGLIISLVLFTSLVNRDSSDILPYLGVNVNSDSLGQNCDHTITGKQLKAEEEIAITLSSECDSNRIFVPPGGTITHCGLYRDATLVNPIAQTPSFQMLADSTNYMRVSSELKGRFFLRYGSCHWGSEMWVNIK
jgi:hypothetical protein